MRVSLFPLVLANDCITSNPRWDELVEQCQRPMPYLSKDRMPLIKLAAFGDKRSSKGALRHDDNVTAISGIEADYDGKVMSVDEAAALLRLEGITALIYTTPSHTEAAPRWRVLVPLSTEYEPQHRRNFVGILNAVLGGVLASESFTLSQTFYYGSVAGAPYRCEVIEGGYIDQVCGLEPYFLNEKTERAANTGQADPLAFSLRFDPTEIADALGHLDADDRNLWITVGQNLKALGDVGFQLWDTWSSTSDKYKAKECLYQWGSFGGTKSGPEAIFAKAAAAGWVNPRSRAAQVAQVVPLMSVRKTSATGVPEALRDYATVKHGAIGLHGLTDAGNAGRLYDVHGDDVKYLTDTESYLYWDGEKWVSEDTPHLTFNLARNVHRLVYKDAELIQSDAVIELMKWAIDSQKERAINSAFNLFKKDIRIHANSGMLDSDDFKVGLNNGGLLVDLKLGETRQCVRSDYITKSTKANYVGDASKAVLWSQFLMQIFNDDIELISWFKRWCGYMLTGSTQEQFLIFCYGHGANGKSVLSAMISHIMGDYATTINSESLCEVRGGRVAGAATPDLMKLLGVRAAICNETDDGGRLNESLVKKLAAGDAIQVRQLHKPEITLIPKAKLMLFGNHKPIIKNSDYGMWRRVRLIPFTRTFVGDEKDPELLSKLMTESPHVLAWFVEGYQEWVTEGLDKLPQVVAYETSEYMREQDVIGEFIEDFCIIDSADKCIFKDMYEVYKTFCVDSGIHAYSRKKFGQKLTERGFPTVKSHSIAYKANISLKPTYPFGGDQPTYAPLNF